MRNISNNIYLCGLSLILASFAASGCATHDAKRDDETYKRPTQTEKQAEQEASSQK